MPARQRKAIVSGRSLGLRVKAIILFLLTILVVAWAVSFLSLQRSTRQVTSLAEQTLPSLTATMQVSRLLEEVVQSSGRLSNADFAAEQRIAYREVTEAIGASRSFMAANSTFASDRDMEEILATLETTAKDLNGLIEGRLDAMAAMVELRRQTLQYLEEDAINHGYGAPYDLWLARLDRATSLSLAIGDLPDARTVRQASRTFADAMAGLRRDISRLPAAARSDARLVLDRLETMFGGAEGLWGRYRTASTLDLRAKALASQMEVMTKELLRELNSLTRERTSAAQASTKALIERSEQELRGLLVAVFFAAALVLASFIYVDRALVRRLGTLQQAVKDRAKGVPVAIPDTGRDEIGQIAAAVRYFISEIDQRQDILVGQAEQIRNIILQSPQAMCIAGGGRILFHNDAFEKLWAGRVAFDTVLLLLPPDLLATGQGVREFARHEMPFGSGESRWFDLASGPANWDGLDARQVILVDVTAQLQVERTLQDAKEKAEAATAAKSSFLAMMSHEIRSPLNGILSVAEILAREDMKPEHRRLVDVINQSSETLLTIINDVLDFSKIEAGKLAIVDADFDVNGLAREVADLYAPEIAKKGLALDLVLDSKLPAQMSGDADRVRQVLFNLLSNAVKFTSEGTVTVVTRRISQAKGDGAVALSVADTGIGISADKLERLFQPFEQADSSTARQFGGTGLGLSISRQLAILMGGTLDVESEPGLGTTFTLILPLHAATGAAPAQKQFVRRPVPVDQPGLAGQATGAASEAGLGGHVLIVEDNPINQLVLGKILSQLSYGFETANDGVEAMKKVEQSQFDLILTDLRMPNMDGFTLAKRVRAMDSDWARKVPIIAISADALQEAQDESLKSGINAFVTKPVKIDDLRSKMSRFLG